MSLNNLAIMQRAVGERESALGSAREAVEQYRQLIMRSHSAFVEAFAMSCRTHGCVQTVMSERMLIRDAPKFASDELTIAGEESHCPSRTIHVQRLTVRVTPAISIPAPDGQNAASCR